MTDNHLFQLAQVVSELPRRSSPSLPPLDHRHDRRILPLRKNACAVCAVCFTCSKNYAVDCTCEETQPRRGKNLPQHGLDSRAKKLNQADKEDYDFAIQWLQENAHAIYRDATSNQVVDLSNQTEVGLCKAHSSTLYRAKKRWEKEAFSSTPASPSDYMDTKMEFAPSRSSSSNTNNTTTPSSSSTAALALASKNSLAASTTSIRIKTEPTSRIQTQIGGGLAAKVKELSQHPPPPPTPTPQLPTDLNIIPSTSHKRKRIDQNGLSTKSQQLPSSGSSMLPHSSASTPLYGTDPLNPSQHHPPSISSPSLSYLSPQLPPLQSQQQQQQQQQQLQQQQSPVSSLSSLSSSLQQQLHLSSGSSSSYHHRRQSPPPSLPSSPSYTVRHHQIPHHHPHHHNNTSLSSQHSPTQTLIPTYHQQQQQQNSSVPPLPPMQPPPIQIETVSLKSMPSDEPCIYFIRNLAITDTFTFRHLLDETDITGAPPPGKRIIIADPTSERIFPLSQPIRSVLPRPVSSHMEFCLGLTDKTSIDWSSCT